MNHKYMWTARPAPVWNEGSDVNPHTLAALTDLLHHPTMQYDKVSYCVVTRWVLIKIESQTHPMKASNMLINNMVHNINPSFFMINL